MKERDNEKITRRATEIVNRFGRLKVLDNPELFIEVKKVEDFRNLQKALRETLGAEVDLEKIVRK